MFPKHLSSELRQYFWIAAVLTGFFLYLPFRYGGRFAPFAFAMGALELACAIAIYRRWRQAPLVYALGCVCLFSWGVTLWAIKGYSHTALWIALGGVFCGYGVLIIKNELLHSRLREHDEDREGDDSCATDGPFILPDVKDEYVDRLGHSYSQAFGALHAVHHIVPKSIWLHRYADYVVTIPPTDSRSSWLYGTLLLSTLSNSRVELILERPQEDTVGAIGTLSMLTQYYLENARLKEWNTMGTHPFYGEESQVRGLLFCKPPAYLKSELKMREGSTTLLYVAGITEQQLVAAQETDDAEGGFAGAKLLYEELEIVDRGIENLAN